MKELVYHRLLLPTVERFADRPAFFDGEYRATFSQHLDRVARLSSGLRDLGVRPDDRFAVMALNGHQFLECYHAAFLGAGVINPLNLRLAPKELEYILADSETKVCFTDQFFAPVIDKVREAVGIEHVVMIGDGDAPHDVRYEDLLASATPRIPDEPEEGDAAVLMYTGGTTGLPKGVLLDHRAEMLNLYHVMQVWRFSSDDVFLHQTPMFHAASMGGMLGVPAQGGTSVFLSLFDPGRALELCEKYSITQTVMVPTMIGMLLNHPEFRPERLASLDTLTYGASPMPAALLDQLLASFPDLDVFQGYGMTESSAVATMNRPGARRLGTVGKPLPGVEATLAGDGELLVRGRLVMRGYRNKPETTVEAVDPDGWLHTGDIAEIDADGFVKIIDRKKELIINAAGKNMSPANIEAAIKSGSSLVGVAVTIGDARPFNTALIVLEPESARAYAREHAIEHSSLDDLAADERIRAEVAAGIERANAKLSRVEQIKKHALLPGEWIPGGDELTPTLKLKRKPIAAKYAEVIEAMYAR
ncbi:MAG: long-chain acyl-CoA synthetase [Actinomycetota bacterium]|nr:long-chain acyl-CoA synthetase [Actinomycetota bacterium]